jgi:flagellar protein FlaG
MSSEISNVVKLSPVTVVKAVGQQEEKQAAAKSTNDDNLAASTQVSGQTLSETQKADAANAARKGKQSFPLDSVKQAVDDGNSLFQATKRNLQFKVDDETNELVVKIVDSESGEVVKQIPAEEMLDLIKRMQDMDGQQGAMLQDQA